MKHNLVLGALFVSSLVLLNACGGGSGSDDESDAGVEGRPITMTVLHINDHHSHLESDTQDLMLAGAETRVNLGGLSSCSG